MRVHRQLEEAAGLIGRLELTAEDVQDIGPAAYKDAVPRTGSS